MSDPFIGDEDDTDFTDVQDSFVVADIFFGEVTIDDNDGKYVEDTDASSRFFTDYVIKNRYFEDGHKYMAGIASPGGFNGNKAAFFQLASSTLLWVCDWTASKYSNQPEIPDPTPTDVNWVLLDRELEPVQLALSGDGVTPLYRISGTYYYGCLNPDPDVLPNISFPRAPWMEDFADRTMPSSKLLQGLSTTEINRQS